MRRTKKMSPLFIGIVAIVGVVVILVWYFLVVSRPNPPLRQNQARVGNAVFAVELATTTVEQARGLSYREGLNDGTGMLFIFGTPKIQHFWMKDMNFPLDIIWIAGGRVAGFAENAPAEPGVPLWGLKIYNSPDGVDKVLEVNAGTVAKDGIKVGDVVAVGN